MDDQHGFRGPQVCGIVGITYRQLDYWDRTGLSRPSLARAHGSGSQRLYSYRDLLELKVIKQLLDAGMNLQKARRAIDCLRASTTEDVATANLVLVGEGSVLLKTGEEIIDLLAGGQGVFNVVPLAGVRDEVDAAILSLEAEPSTASAQVTAASKSATPGAESGLTSVTAKGG